MTLSRRKFIRTLGGTGVVLAATGLGLTRCDQMPPEAVAAWKGAGNVSADPRTWMLAHAILAPNPHNMQPWIADLREPGVISLLADRTRLLAETDPFGRQIMIGLGCFVELINIASAEAGYRTDARYFPDGQYPDGKIGESPFARITLTQDRAARRDPLFAQILKRRSTKEPYDTNRPIETAHATAMVGSFKNSRRGTGNLSIEVETGRVGRLRQIAIEAMTIEMQTPRTLEESIDRVRIGADAIARHRDGIELHGPLFWWMEKLGLMTKEKSMTPGTMAYQGGMDYALGWANATPSFGWLTTPANDRVAQLDTGRDYVRLNLKAAEQGVAMHPVSQVLQEYAEMATLQQRFLKETATPDGATVQMLFRLGYADTVPPSPRRDLAAIIRKA